MYADDRDGSLTGPGKRPSTSAGAPTIAREELARLGKSIYQRDIKASVEGNHHGEVVAIDVESGQWAVASDILAATDLLREHCPDALNVYCERVGHRTLWRLPVYSG